MRLATAVGFATLTASCVAAGDLDTPPPPPASQPAQPTADLPYVGAPGIPDPTPKTRPLAERKAELAAKRALDWRAKHPFWEVFWDGSNTPADGVPGPFMWDNPIDDDWYEPLLAGYDHYWVPFRLNTFLLTPTPGFMTVDRNFFIGSKGKTGSIWRRDEYLDPDFVRAAYGLTIELRVKLLPDSGKRAFHINVVGRDCTMGIALSGSIAAPPVGDISSGTIGGVHTNAQSLDVTTDLVTLRVVRAPLSSTFEVFVVAYGDENAPRPLQWAKVHEGECRKDFIVGSAPNVNHPYIQVGDNSNEPTSNAGFVLDYVRYRRDAFRPEDTLASLHPRTPVALPPSPQAGDDYLFAPSYQGSASGGWFGDTLPTAAGAVALAGASVKLAGSTGHFTASGAGTAIFAAGPNKDYGVDFEIMKPHGLSSGGNFTIQLRLKLRPDSGPRGFRLSYVDILGAVTLYFSVDKVETALGFKPAGYLAHAMDTTDGFHTYRLVRKAGELYAHLYVDEDPVPVIVDQHLSGETEVYGNFQQLPIITFGQVGIYPEPSIWPMKRTYSNVEVDYIRWHGYAFAPKE